MRTRPVLSLVCGLTLGCGPLPPPEGATGESSSGGVPVTVTTVVEPGGDATGSVSATAAPTTGGGTTGSSDAAEAGSSGVPETGSSAGASETGCHFICDPTDGCGEVWVEGEGYQTRCSNECDTWAQDCPRGQKCVAWAEGGGGSWNATKCVMVTGDGAPGEPCMTIEGGTSGVDTCAEGVMCWDVNENNMGTCVALCSGNPESPMCPDEVPCTISGNGVLNLCLPGCDPLLQDCPGTDLCIPNGDNFVCVLDASGEEGQAHDVCEFANACDKGLVCLDTADASSACDPAAAGCCEPFCEFPDGACPAADQQCVQWFDPATLPMDDPKLEIGVCRIPK